MARKWIKSKKYTGVRWQLHSKRKYGVQFDKHYGYRFMCAGKQYEGLLGWASEGWNESSAALKRSEYLENAKKGLGARSPQEEIELQQKEALEEKQKHISFEEYFAEKYLPEAKTRKAEKTLRGETQHVRDWLSPYLQRKPLVKIEVEDLEEVKMALFDVGRSKRTVQHVLSTFRLVWNHAKKRRYVDRDSPSSLIEIGKIDNARTRFFSPEEIQKLLRYIRERDEASYLFTFAALNTGARLTELSKVKWGDVDLCNRFMKIMHSKTKKVRSIPLTDELYAELERLEKGKASELVFKNFKGERWKEAPWHFREGIRELGFNDHVTDSRDRLCFHSLRHSTASYMQLSNIDGQTIISLLGWSSMAMLQRYSHTIDSAKKNAMNVVSNVLNCNMEE